MDGATVYSASTLNAFCCPFKIGAVSHQYHGNEMIKQNDINNSSIYTCADIAYHASVMQVMATFHILIATIILLLPQKVSHKILSVNS